MNKRILLSLGTLVVAGAVIAGGTGAFFSDTETSTGNVFTTGSVTLELTDITHTYGGDDSNNPTQFSTNPSGFSFAFADLKPLDSGNIAFDLQNGANEAFVCARVIGGDDEDVTLVDQEVALSDDLTDGELDDFLSFSFNGNVGTISDVDGQWALLGTAAANGPTGSSVDYCFGDIVGGTCVASANDTNIAQTDSLSADVEFYAVQTRNNEGFQCSSLNDEVVDSRPTIGADLTAYVAPAADVTVLAGESIQAAIDAATEGQVIVVEPGTYSPFVVDKGLTIAAAAGPDSGTPVTIVPVDATYGQLAEVTADNVTITGFVFDGQDLPSTGARTAGVNVETSVANPDLSNVEVSYNRIVNINSATLSGQTGSYSLKLFSENGRSMTNVLVEHNVINGANNAAGGAYGIQSVGELNNAVMQYNTITDINSSGWSLGLAIDAKVTETTTDVAITRNVVESGADADIQVEKNASAGSVTVNENNLVSMLHGGGAYVATDGVDGTVNAENNWWGDVDASDNFIGSVDFDPEEASAFPTN